MKPLKIILSSVALVFINAINISHIEKIKKNFHLLKPYFNVLVFSFHAYQVTKNPTDPLKLLGYALFLARVLRDNTFKDSK
jgi:hypothetical protein